MAALGALGKLGCPLIGSLGRSSAKAQRTEVRSQALERTDGDKLNYGEVRKLEEMLQIV